MLGFLFSLGMSETAKVATGVGVGVAVGTVVGLGIGSGVRHHDDEKLVRSLFADDEKKEIVATINQPLLADTVSRYIHEHGVATREEFIDTLRKLNAKYGSATTNVVLYTSYKSPKLSQLIQKTPTVDSIMNACGASLLEFKDINDIASLPGNINKSEDPSAVNLRNALKLCFERKIYVKTPSEKNS